MRDRPQPKKSTIAGRSPIPVEEPVLEKVTAEAAPERSVAQPPELVPAVVVQPLPAAPAKPGEPRYPKVSIYMDPERADRVRAAYMHTMSHLGTQSFSSFMGRAVMAYVEQLEKQFNDGVPFPQVQGRMPLIRD
ncbi:hypothetical protein H5398_16060 [Tessaracoccus sp. MC1679]|nr:hypothetical protein [Tessaracoccus sp. MC1679]